MKNRFNPLDALQTYRHHRQTQAEEKATLRTRLREVWRRSLTNGSSADPSEVVIAELSEYFKLPPEQVKERCINWERYSREEWLAKDRQDVAGLQDFYQTQTSWIFDTMWYHAQQYHDLAPAQSIEIAAGLSRPPHDLKPGHNLDFGAGPGSSSLFFHELGWQVSLADISTTMQNFARWRLAKHGVPATFYDTTSQPLPAATFDLITAFDVMAHVPDASATLAMLRQALTPGGYLVFNIDNRPPTLDNASHLYAEQYPILREVGHLGFRRYAKFGSFHVYRKVEYRPFKSRLIYRLDRLRYNRLVTTFVGKPVRYLRRRLKV